MSEDISMYKKMTIEHDKHIDALTTSISHLVESVGSTNRKLEDIVEVIAHQNVLVERMNNLDTNLKESFDRIHTSARANDSAIRSLQKDKDTFVTKKTSNIFLSILLTYTIAFASYMLLTLHALADEFHSHESMFDTIIPTIERRLIKLEDVSHKAHK